MNSAFSMNCCMNLMMKLMTRLAAIRFSTRSQAQTPPRRCQIVRWMSYPTPCALIRLQFPSTNRISDRVSITFPVSPSHRDSNILPEITTKIPALMHRKASQLRRSSPRIGTFEKRGRIQKATPIVNWISHPIRSNSMLANFHSSPIYWWCRQEVAGLEGVDHCRTLGKRNRWVRKPTSGLQPQRFYLK